MQPHWFSTALSLHEKVVLGQGRGQSCPLREQRIHFAPRRNFTQKEMIPSIKYLQNELGQKNANGLKLNIRCNSSPSLPGHDGGTVGWVAIASLALPCLWVPRTISLLPNTRTLRARPVCLPQEWDHHDSHPQSLLLHLLNPWTSPTAAPSLCGVLGWLVNSGDLPGASSFYLCLYKYYC